MWVDHGQRHPISISSSKKKKKINLFWKQINTLTEIKSQHVSIDLAMKTLAMAWFNKSITYCFSFPVNKVWWLLFKLWKC